MITDSPEGKTNYCLACLLEKYNRPNGAKLFAHTCGKQIPKIAQILQCDDDWVRPPEKSWDEKLDELCLIEGISDTGKELLRELILNKEEDDRLE